jgi:AcrR family transcriptional regulator
MRPHLPRLGLPQSTRENERAEPCVSTIGTVSDLGDRRARKKARTRTEIRAAAQQLFDERGFDAVTIADIARQADVAVQTVFNHFASKEELFFDGRVPWVEGPAEAVRSRAGKSALEALRRYLVGTARSLVEAHGSPERRRQLHTLEASPTLRSYERELVHAAETRLAEALGEAWAAEGADTAGPSTGTSLSPTVTAAIWLTSTRALVTERREQVAAGADARTAATETAAAADRLLARLERSLSREPVGATG